MDENWTTGLIRFAGVVGDSMSTRIDEQHGKPALEATAVARPTDTKGVCPERVAEGLVVPMKPGNAGGGNPARPDLRQGHLRDRYDGGSIVPSSRNSGTGPCWSRLVY